MRERNIFACIQTQIIRSPTPKSPNPKAQNQKPKPKSPNPSDPNPGIHRWILRGKISKADRGGAKGGQAGGGGAAGDGGLVTSILICDDEEEERMALGRGWPHRPLGFGEAHVSSSMLRTLGRASGLGFGVFRGGSRVFVVDAQNLLNRYCPSTSKP